MYETNEYEMAVATWSFCVLDDFKREKEKEKQAKSTEKKEHLQIVFCIFIVQQAHIQTESQKKWIYVKNWNGREKRLSVLKYF